MDGQRRGRASSIPTHPIRPPSTIEIITYGATRLFSGHLRDAGIPHAYNYYGGGTHICEYWARDLQEYVGPLMARFTDPPPAPRSISYMSGDDRFQQWEWSVELQRPTPGFSRLLHASPAGFALVGTGTASVRTPPLFAPGTRVRVHKRGRLGHTQSLLTVGTSGRLRLSVPLSDDAPPAGDPRQLQGGTMNRLT